MPTRPSYFVYHCFFPLVPFLKFKKEKPYMNILFFHGPHGPRGKNQRSTDFQAPVRTVHVGFYRKKAAEHGIGVQRNHKYVGRCSSMNAGPPRCSKEKNSCHVTQPSGKKKLDSTCHEILKAPDPHPQLNVERATKQSNTQRRTNKSSQH